MTPRGSMGIEPLPEIEASPEEEVTTELVARVMRALAEQGGESAPSTIIVMRGGTAAKLAYGLTRPSKDIDLDIVGGRRDRDIWSLIEEAAEHAGLLAIAERDRKSRLKGRLQLSDGRAPSLTIDVDARPVHEPATGAAIAEGRITARRNGILTYRPGILAEQKLALAALPEPRLRAKDRYDIAWWLTHGIEHVPPQLRTDLDQTLRDRPEIRGEWDRKHRLDAVTQRIDPMSVHRTLTTALDHDPVVLVRRQPGSSLELNVGLNAGGQLTWQRTPDDREPRLLARFANDQDVQRYMTAYGIWDRRDVPERIRELQAERARARQKTR